jgi:tetratricopeptide (TPR) repeat protein
MILCNLCQTQNGLESKFCKQCGTALPDDAVKEASDRFDKLVQEGYGLFNQSRTAEAIQVAQNAVRDNPQSANAYSLLGMCFERTGQLAEALDAFERVLDLSPESPLDRIKVSQLRHSLTEHLKIDTRSNKRFAMIGAFSVAVIIFVGGIFLAFAQRSKAPVASTDTTTVASNIRPFDTANPAAQAVNQPTQAAPNLVTPQSVTPASQQQVTPTVTAQRPKANIFEGDAAAPAESASDPGETDSSPKFGPLHIQPETTPATPNTQQSLLGGSSDPVPVDASSTAKPADSSADPKPEEAAKAPDDPGIIQISVTHRSSGGGSAQSSAGSSDPNELQALLKTAKNEFLLGHYDSSARTYGRSMIIGGDSASINQRIGMCYQKLGKTDDAVVAYQHAISSYQGALNSGTGNSKRLQSGLDACKQALKLLKG